MSWLRNAVDKAVTAQTEAAEIQSPRTPADVAVLERVLPAGPRKPLAAVDTSLMAAEAIADYRATAEQIGLDPQDIIVEEFRHFLAANDMPTFNLNAVVSYMDELVAKDNPTGFGWHWCPVRPKDSEVAMTWGKPSQHERGGFIGFSRERQPEVKVPGSDFYQSHLFHQDRDSWAWQGGVIMTTSDTKTPHVPSVAEVMQADIEHGFRHRAAVRAFWESPSPAYTRTLPLHALKKIAAIERAFQHKVVFLVTEYTTRAQITINPDPFLMAVIPNTAVSHGKGRFIIDVWDEPGFGIKQMLA